MNNTTQSSISLRIKKWLKYLLIMSLVIGLGVVIWVEYEMRLMNGQFTPEIETADLNIHAGPLIIKNTHILRADASAFTPGQDVLIDDGRIIQTGVQLDAPADASIIDGSAQYLIPGLMDGHVHLRENRNNLWLYLANGVTHVRDMGGTDYQLAVRDSDPAEVLRPDVFVSSEKVYDTPWWQVWYMNWTRSRITMSDASQGDDIVQDLVERGFDGLKISNGLTAEQYRSLVSAAHQQGLLVTGHIPNSVSLDEVFALGQQEIAHVEEITKAFDREYGLAFSDLTPQTATEYLDYVRSRSEEVAPVIKAKGIHITSVVWLMESLVRQKLALEEFLGTVELVFVDPHELEGWKLARGWLPGNHSYASSPYWLETEERRQKLKLFWDTYVDAIHIMTRALVRHEVPFTAGTDSVVTGGVAGFSLHDELESLVKLGMTPAQALRTATVIPGQWLEQVGKGSQSGQIRAGDPANLVLLNANPLIDINNTRQINSVIIHGHLLTREQLDIILERIKTINDNERSRDISAYLKHGH